MAHTRHRHAHRRAGGGFLLSILVWFSLFPPSGNPVIGEEHMAFAFSLLLFDVLAYWQSIRLDRWLEAHTVAAALNSATTIKLRPTFRAGIHRF